MSEYQYSTINLKTNAKLISILPFHVPFWIGNGHKHMCVSVTGKSDTTLNNDRHEIFCQKVAGIQAFSESTSILNQNYLTVIFLYLFPAEATESATTSATATTATTSEWLRSTAKSSSGTGHYVF